MKFTLRDLLWLLAVVGILCAWYAHVERTKTRLYAYYNREIMKVGTAMQVQDKWRKELVALKKEHQKLQAKYQKANASAAAEPIDP
jgi:hypothetical protein